MFNFLKKKNNTPKLPYTTEVHCHVLPGIDDGSPDVEHSLALIHQMKECDLSFIPSSSIGSAYSRLCQETNLDELGIKLCYSAEYRMDDNFLGILQREEIIPMPGNHILIENSFLQPFWNIKSLVFDLQIKGLSPILAHPERYAYYYDDKKIYKELHEQGCEFQVNLLSLAGYYNKRAKEVAEWLISKQMVDYLGSDLHNSSHVLHINKYLSGKEYPKHMRNIHIKNNHL